MAENDSDINRIPENISDRLKRRIEKNKMFQGFAAHGRIPPQAVDMEEAVLGAMMSYEGAMIQIIDFLKPEIFYKESHQIICSAALRLFAKNAPIDILTVTDELKSGGQLELVGGAYFITTLTNRISGVESVNIVYHTRIILQKYIARELIRIGSDVIKDAFEDTTDVFDLLDRSGLQFISVGRLIERGRTINLAMVSKENMDEVIKIQSGEIKSLGILTKFRGLDETIFGLRAPDLLILAARPGMGKTALIVSLLKHICVEDGIPTAMFSLEMSVEQIELRLKSQVAKVSYENMKKVHALNLEEIDRLQYATNLIIDSKLKIDDSPALNYMELKAKARRFVMEFGIKLIIIDYLQLMSSIREPGKTQNRENEVSEMSRNIKSLAKELNIPIILLSQLSRAVELRKDKRPVLADLRESGSIEQDADIVIFIYRYAYYEVKQFDTGVAVPDGLTDLMILKHRNGKTGYVKVKFVGELMSFENFHQSEGVEDVSTQPDLPF